MEFGSNFVLFIIFTALSIWMGYNYFSTKKRIVLKDFMWTVSRIAFVIAAVMLALTIFMYQTWFDILRMIVMILCIVFFLLLRDGIGETGIVSMGQFTEYKNVRGYDFSYDKKNRFHVYFTCHNKSSKNSEYVVVIMFEGKDVELVKRYLKEHIGKKYIRMKKKG